MSEHDLDPLDALEDPNADDSIPEIVTDKTSVCFTEPAANIKPRKKA